jgi:hypothetical protein
MDGAHYDTPHKSGPVSLMGARSSAATRAREELGVDVAPLRVPSGPFGSHRRNADADALPCVWHVLTNVLMDRSKPPPAEPVPGVRGALMVKDVLSRAECATFVQLAETLGFDDGAQTVAVPRIVRANDACVMLAPSVARELSARMSRLLPDSGASGCPRVCSSACISARLRCYRYLPATAEGGRPADRFAAHYDGSQTPAGARLGELVEDCSNGTQMSQMSLLLYLTDSGPDEGGGHTVFYPDRQSTAAVDGALPAAPTAERKAVRVRPTAGSAVMFWHGDHPDSPLHEGEPLRTGEPPKYVLRSDVLFALPEARPALATEWEPCATASAMARAAAMMTAEASRYV